MLFIARDIEESIIANKYNEILKTKDIEYQALIKEIIADTVKHKNQLEKKIEEIKNVI